MAETLILAAPYLAAASTGISAISAISGAQQQSAAMATQAEYQRANAEQARINAGSALNASEAEAARAEAQARRRSATAFNAAAGSGVDPTFGSPLDLMADIAAEGALDTQIQRWKGRNQAAGYQTQAGNFEAQGAASDIAGSNVAAAGPIRAGTTLLGGLAQYGMMRSRAGAY
jgi:hypothetical protein